MIGNCNQRGIWIFILIHDFLLGQEIGGALFPLRQIATVFVVSKNPNQRILTEHPASDRANPVAVQPLSNRIGPLALIDIFMEDAANDLSFLRHNSQHPILFAVTEKFAVTENISVLHFSADAPFDTL